MVKKGVADFTAIFDERLVKELNNLCQCGHPRTSITEFLLNGKDFICTNCGRDNTSKYSFQEDEW